MKIDDVCCIEEGNSVTASTYWIGSTTALGRGHYDRLRPVIVLAKGRYTEYYGECGTAVQPSSLSTQRLVVATWAPGYRHGEYVRNRWVPRVISGSALRLTNAEYGERVRLQHEDLVRHQAARRKVQDERDALSKVVVGELLNGLAKNAKLHFKRDYKTKAIEDYTITITLKPGTLKRKLSPEARKALAELPKLKDPAC